MEKIENKTLYLNAIEGGLLMPIFFYHLYVVTHKEQISKRTLNESSEDPVDVEKIIQYSHASSDFHWRDSASSGQVGRGSEVGSLLSS